MVKAIIAKVNPFVVTKPIRQALISESELAKSDMEKTTVNFQQVSPTFIIENQTKGANLIRVIGPEDNKSGQIWVFLDLGTDIRYAVMTPDFIPKTSPNTLVTTLGVGGLSHFDFENPRPGIEPRLWTELIAEVRQKSLQKRVDKILKTAKLFSN